jgi:hypothetical protein
MKAYFPILFLTIILIGVILLAIDSHRNLSFHEIEKQVGVCGTSYL